MRLAVIGADPWFVEAVRAVLAGRGGVELALVAPDAEAFMRGGETRDIDVAILTCEGPDRGRQLVGWARRHRPGLRVVVKYPALRPDLVRDAMRAGAWGCFSAEDPPATLLTLLDSVAAGRVSFPYVDFETLRDDPFEQLTRRERELLAALARGWTNHQISARLGISENTVKYHLKLIYQKLGVANRATAVARYLARMQG